MADAERNCVVCGTSDELARLDKCGVCGRYFCPDCGFRAIGGRKFCSPDCARSYYFHGEMDEDDNEDSGTEDD